METPRAALLLLVLLTTVLVAAMVDSSSEKSKLTILIPVADTLLGSFEGADEPMADDAMEDEGAVPVGSLIGTTMTEPKPELPNSPPDSIEVDEADTSGSGAAASTLLVATVMVVVATAGIFAF